MFAGSEAGLTGLETEVSDTCTFRILGEVEKMRFTVAIGRPKPGHWQRRPFIPARHIAHLCSCDFRL